MSVSRILVNSNSEEQKAILEILEFYDYNKNTLNDDENKIKCKYCKEQIKFKFGDPSSNLYRHLRIVSVRHNELHKILAEKDMLTPSRTKKNSTLATSKPTPTTPAKGLKRKLDTILSSPQQVIRFFEEYKHSDPKKIKLDLKLCNFVVSKSLPISIVDAVEFREFLSLLDNRYKPPNSQTLKNTIIPRCREKIKFILIEKLNKVESINLITDIWSDTSMRSFIAFAVHGIDDEWGIFRALLCCKHLIGSHTNEAIFNTFMDIINEYNLGGKVFKIASDGASNMVKAFNTTHIDDYIDTFQQLCQSIDEKVDRDNELNTDEVESEDEDVGDGENDGLEIDENIISTDTIANDISLELYNVGRVGCAAHKLQLAIKDGLNLEVASDLIKKISTIINKGKHSCQVMDILRESKKCLKAKNDTRWNSVYFMLKSFSKLSNSEIEMIIHAGKRQPKKGKKTLADDLRFSSVERQKINELLQILQELQICTDIIQGDGITVSRILPSILTVLHKIDLKSQYELIMSKDNTIDPKIFYFEELSEKLIISIKQRFKDVLEDPFYYVCSMLDPNYGIIWIKPQEKSYWIDKLKTLVEEFDDNQTLSDMTEKNSKNKKNSQDNWTISYDDESFTQSNLEYDVLIKLFFETQKQSRALHRENEKGHIDPLQWWKFNQEKFLSLAKIAKKILAVPASSGSIERFFSKTGYILRQHRRQMKDKTAENLFFLKENKDFLQQL